VSDDGAARPRGGAATRERILEAASELLYAQGIRATSADRVIEQVGITKVTFYRHFRTKDDLVVAFLERRLAWEQEMAAQALTGQDPDEALRRVAHGIGADSCRPGFRGCPFINAGAEYVDPAHPVRQAVDAQRRWMVGLFADIATRGGVTDPTATADQLMMLRDGAMVSGYLGAPQTVAESLAAAFLAVVRSGTHPSP
jgi:AcrR family transcriptional regulator